MRESKIISSSMCCPRSQLDMQSRVWDYQSNCAQGSGKCEVHWRIYIMEAKVWRDHSAARDRIWYIYRRSLFIAILACQLSSMKQKAHEWMRINYSTAHLKTPFPFPALVVDTVLSWLTSWGLLSIRETTCQSAGSMCWRVNIWERGRERVCR